MAHRVNFITGNANKLREVKAILEPSIEVQSQSVDLEEVQGTIEEVSIYKCRKAAELVRLDVQKPNARVITENSPRFKVQS